MAPGDASTIADVPVQPGRHGDDRNDECIVYASGGRHEACPDASHSSSPMDEQ